MNTDHWAWLEKPIDPCPKDLVIPPKRDQKPKCGLFKRFWSRITRKRDCDDE